MASVAVWVSGKSLCVVQVLPITSIEARCASDDHVWLNTSFLPIRKLEPSQGIAVVARQQWTHANPDGEPRWTTKRLATMQLLFVLSFWCDAMLPPYIHPNLSHIYVGDDVFFRFL